MERLVIVEDHELLATTLALALRQQGLQVSTVAGPTIDAVVDFVRQLAPVLVLLDLDLGPPLGSGLDLIEPLTVAGGRVVMMTGVADQARLGACIEAGAVGIVSKTAGFPDLIDAIGQAVAGVELLTEHQRQLLSRELQIGRQANQATRNRMTPFTALSPREQAVLVAMVSGESAETIARLSYVSLATVRTQIRSILSKLSVKTQLAAVALARQAGWPEPTADRSLPDIHQTF